MKWIKRNKIIVIVLITLFLTGAILGISYKRYQDGKNIPSFLNSIFIKVIGPVTKAGHNANNTTKGFFYSLDLIEENKDLKAQNAKLKEDLAKNLLQTKELAELKKLSKALNYDFIKNSRKLITTDIIAFDNNKELRTFSINAGEDSGIRTGNIVICGDYLVGKVYSTTNSTSKVIAITDGDNKVSFTTRGNKDILGITNGSKNGKIKGYMIDRNSNIKEGDEIITSGTGIYPKGIVIGKVINVIKNSDRQFTEVQIKSKASLGNLDKVSVII